MEVGSVIQFLENKTILVTGATGFLAKVFVEKILRVQPNIKKLYLLIRAADAKSASIRLHNKVIGNDLFRVLRENHGENFQLFIEEKVIPVPGDIARDNLGMQDPDLAQEMYKEVEIVVNSAATTRFDERYDISLRTNTLGAKKLVNFVKKCAKIRMILHTSTAYVSGKRTGLIVEDPQKMGESLNGTPGLDIDDELNGVEAKLNELKANRATEKDITLAMKEFGLQRAKKYGWPNTYVFTKAMGEMVYGYMKEDLPLVILRPTMVISTFKEPFPGWIEGLKTIDAFVAGYGTGKLKFIVGDPESTTDVIPADFVVNAMLVAMAAKANQRCNNNKMTIYHVGSSKAHPVKLAEIRDYMIRYFTDHPLVGNDGKPVKVGKPTELSSMASFNRYMSINYLLPLKGLKIANTACCQYFQGVYVDRHKRIWSLMRMMKLCSPYLFFKAIYDDSNTEKLQITAANEGSVKTDVFYFDPRIINWEDYFVNTHIPGLVRYAIKQ